MQKIQKGFTLVELLVVMAILGVLVTLIASGFRNAQLRGHDTQRKSDLKEIANALEIFYSDYGYYPPDATGYIAACPYNSSTQTGTSCAWGNSEMTDNKTVYFKLMPSDPVSSYSYFYRIVPGSNQQKYQLYAHLENTQDPDIISGLSVTCGGTTICNFSVHSANTTATE